MTTPSSDLERRYRRLVALFPPSYRAARGEEMIGLLLDLAPPGQTRPSWAERADLLRAVVARWALAAFTLPPARRRETCALLAYVFPFALLYPAARTITGVVALAAAPWGDGAAAVGRYPFAVPWALWVVAVALVALGRVRPARLFAVSATVAFAAVLAASVATDHRLDGVREPGWLLAQVCTVTAFAAVIRTGDRPTRTDRSLGVMVAVAAVCAGIAAELDPSLMWRLPHLVLATVLAAALACTRHRHAIPFLGAAGALLYVGRYGPAMQQIPLSGLVLDVGDVLVLVGAPLLVYLGLRLAMNAVERAASHL